jgi:hypothetical protein
LRQEKKFNQCEAVQNVGGLSAFFGLIAWARSFWSEWNGLYWGNSKWRTGVAVNEAMPLIALHAMLLNASFVYRAPVDSTDADSLCAKIFSLEFECNRHALLRMGCDCFSLYDNISDTIAYY